MEGKTATQGSTEHRPVRQELGNQKFADEFQSKGKIRNKSQKQFLEWKSSWQRGGQMGDTSGEMLLLIWKFIWRLFLWVALGILVIIMEKLVSAKADSTGQRIYSAGLVNQTLPVTESARIQHLGQVQPRRILMAHGKGSTGNFGDVPDTEEKAASLEKVPAKASLLTTSRGIREEKGKNESQSLQLKQGGSGGIGGVG